MRIYALEIEILDPKTLTVIKRHLKCCRPGGVKMEDADRIFNPSRMTESFLDQAAKIGPKTRELCEQFFKDHGRVGQRRMRGVLSLAQKHCATLIEEACEVAVRRRVQSSKTVRELVERLEEKILHEKSIQLTCLTQHHDLIREPGDYALFFESHAFQVKS